MSIWKLCFCHIHVLSMEGSLEYLDKYNFGAVLAAKQIPKNTHKKEFQIENWNSFQDKFIFENLKESCSVQTVLSLMINSFC